MSARDKRIETRVGLFVIIGLAMIAGLILQFGRIGDRMIGHYPLTVVFNDASGLIKGSDIRMGGARIGKVSETPMLNEQLKAEVNITVNERIRIPVGSQFQIASATILGDKLIQITPPPQPSGQFIEENARITGGGPSGLEAIQNNAEAVSYDARRLMKNAEETLAKVDGAVVDIRTATQRLSTAMERVNTSLLSESNLQSLSRSIGNFEQSSAALNPALTDARETLAAIRKATENANTRIDEIAPAFKQVPQAVASIKHAADKAGSAIDRVSGGEGLLGTLAEDKGVSADTKSFIKNLRQYGILRYRDVETKEEFDPRNRYRGKRR